MAKKQAPQAPTAAERYDRALQRGRQKSPVPEGCPVPQPTAVWPAENVALLERYQAWLEAGSTSAAVINQHRIPMAGHVLGLNLKPHGQLDISAEPVLNLTKGSRPALGPDLDKAMAYIEAKQCGATWTDNCRHSLRWFRRFLCLERGLVAAEEYIGYSTGERFQEGLPAWLLAQLEQYLHLRQANWRPSRLAQATYRFWFKYTRVWHWLLAHYPITELTDIKRQHLYTYMDEMLTAGYASSTVNVYLSSFQATLQFMQGRGFQVPQAVLKVRGLKTADSLPRFLTDEQLCWLRQDVEQRVQTADTPARRRDALLDRATFYLLWQAGLRVGELEELTLADLNLGKKRLMVRQGKGVKDRTVYLTDTTVTAIEDYLTVRGDGASDHLFLYRHRPLSRDLVRNRIKAAGKRTNVRVTPHRLRHTFATQLVNAGCKVTSIQALLGHRRLNSTMIYARVHDQVVAQDYATAMAVIEERLQPHLHPLPEQDSDSYDLSSGTNGDDKAAHLLTLVAELQLEPLTHSQQVVVSQLQQGLATLAKSLPGVMRPTDQLVKVQAISVP